ncbi:exodeoxyribonuclease VII small subunit [Collinsella tanakaei]|uniref:Exodeoxyribonuclease 7 small subunit n=1 Tax=Collinsella ihumii TaxID=1720204 RepID=A0A921IMZ2_9ACTN|nr:MULTISPECIES: exodeoxyribonuclease VII small subunit [Collinsella]MBM6688584.1 exodeoxyribonuclease VII small subunit [Collinsella tanakaei]MBM6777279.1 exodeoxyribonuclease VII small subunit [Collinsella tanakaei]MBM6784601.1 exodeoxyribonuclease VII small subunit [Collinsella tanakaei]MCF6413845.1 exodeoxyribonuclease VII small subunit [Collinsella tanakaei]MDN0056471.1 exodeoxyribonuclease VII small subunit [Collinsella ihumii]
MATSKKNVDELTYKEASTELELIIRNLESGDMELEESLESYTRGVELLRSLRARLEDAEQKVSVLLKDVDGTDKLVAGEAADTSDRLSF